MPRLSLIALVAARSAAAQAPPPPATPPLPATPSRIEALVDPLRLVPAEVAYVHPLYRPLDEPARLVEKLPPQDLETRVTLVLTLHVAETGKVIEGAPVEPPLKGLAIPVAALLQRWRFKPAKKGGRPVPTWATHGLELNVELEKPIFTVFNLRAVAKEDPLPAAAKQPAEGEDWMAKYPREIDPPDPAAVSVEDVDVMPSPEKTPWSFDAARARSTVTALVEVSATGAVTRLLPTGDAPEPLAVSWMRSLAPKWKISPAMAGGRAVESWMVLNTTLEYNLASAKKKSERSIKKNLRGPKAE
jgi:hypothetical protein